MVQFVPQPARVGSLALSRGDLRQHLAALAWLDVDAEQGREHLALPSDLFLLTVYGDDTLLCGEPHDAGDLQVLISALRTRRAHFHARGHGHLALALLTPAGLIRLLRAPLAGLTDRRVPLAQFVGWTEQRRLRDLLRTTGDRLQRLALLGHWIEGRLHQRQRLSPAQRRTADAASLMQHRAAATGLAFVYEQSGITRRQLERDFRHWLGLSPAAYARSVRFQQAAASILRGSSIIDTALEHRFADQSHMNRVFKALSGMTPAVLAALASIEARAQERRALAGRLLMVDVPRGQS